MKIKVVNQRLYLEPPETAEGTREYLRAEFSFSEEWDGTVKTAFFRGADGENHPKLLEDDTCTVPTEALAAPGRVGVSVSGTLGETVITTDIKSFTLPATLSGGTPSDPGPTLWQEVLDKFEKVSEVEEKVTELDKKCDTIPTRVSQLENNSGFLTEHQDISGKLDAEKLPEAIDTALAQAKESGEFVGEPGPKGDPGETTYIENPYDDTKIKKEIAAKVGYSEVVGNQLLMYADDTKEKLLATLELPSGVEDVQVNGESIVQNGVAEIPITGFKGNGNIVRTGMVKIPKGYGLDFLYNTQNLVISNPSTNFIDNRNNIWQADYYALTVRMIDYAVKSAMCDGKGAAWTEEEQAAARERMGIDEWEDVLDVTLEKDSLFSADFEHEYKQLYIYIDQSGVTEKICTVTYLHPYSYVNSECKKINTFASYYPSTSNALPNVASVWKSYGKVTTRIASVTNDQKNTTGNQTTCLKVWDTSMSNINGIGDPFKGIYPSSTIFKAGTRIVIKGVRT